MCCRSLLSTYSRPPSCLWSTDTLLGWFQWWKALKNSLLPRHQWQQKGPLCLPFKFNSNEIEERRKEFNFSLCILLSRCSRSMISPAIKVQMTQSDISTPTCACAANHITMFFFSINWIILACYCSAAFPSHDLPSLSPFSRYLSFHSFERFLTSGTDLVCARA